MKNEISEKIQNSNRPLGIVVGKATVRCFVPLAIVTATCAAFLPILWNDFVEWDDYETLVSNQNFRGLGWGQLGWMFTTFHMGHYQPLSWLTLAFDYSIWGMNPVGYHITNVLLHSANAVSLYFVTRQLLTLAVSESDGEIHENLRPSAGYARQQSTGGGALRSGATNFKIAAAGPPITH